MDVLACSYHILQDLKDILDETDGKQAEALLEDIRSAKRIFVAAAGRSLLVMKAFAMRLMHLGFTVYVVGEVVTPAIGEGDLLLTGSGSGKTATLQVVAEKAKKAGARLDVLTIYADASIAKLADRVLVIPAATNQVAAGKASWQPGGSSFEQSLLILLDGLIAALADRLGLPVTDALRLHANLE